MQIICNISPILGLASLAALGLNAAHPAFAQTTTVAPGVLAYGTENQEGAGPYAAGFNPKAGATLIGLTAGQTHTGS